jgi:hypothetical protein
MQTLIYPARHIISIQSFLISWYWFRKEHQTRLEFRLHNLSPETRPPIINVERSPPPAPARSRYPNAGDLLFRYGRAEHMLPLLKKGAIRIAAGTHFNGIEGDTARSDEETSRHSYVKILNRDGREIRPTGDISRTVSLPNYFLLCMSSDLDIDLFGDFSADSCVKIREPEEFARRLETAAVGELDGWYFHCGHVHYLDPYERMKNEVFEAGMCKYFILRTRESTGLCGCIFPVASRLLASSLSM